MWALIYTLVLSLGSRAASWFRPFCSCEDVGSSGWPPSTAALTHRNSPTAPRAETLCAERRGTGWSEKCGFMHSLCNSLPGWPWTYHLHLSCPSFASLCFSLPPVKSGWWNFLLPFLWLSCSGGQLSPADILCMVLKHWNQWACSWSWTRGLKQCMECKCSEARMYCRFLGLDFPSSWRPCPCFGETTCLSLR